MVVQHSLMAQVSHIGGVINSYAAVQVLNYCENKLTVSNTSGFSPNQKVLMIQMKGAQVAVLNNMQFGTVEDYKGCGNFEINTIEWIAGNDIKLKYAIVRDYEQGGSIQLVSIPEYVTATTDSTLRVKNWDGSSGGVFILKTDTLILNDSITVLGAGFKGAALENEINCWNNGNGGANDYVYATSAIGARKGEGIGNTPYPFGRGKNGNGGGGGDDHNTGGGGGSNYGAGGRGGTRSNTSQFSCPGPSPGEGGMALTYSNTANKIFMGGGGGAGDENNNEGTPGGDGGGICIIMAKFLLSNDQKINANGRHVPVKALSDGAGAGGAGGTVLLYVDSYLGNLLVNANGGNGGKLDNGGSMTFCFGPGAGGGGGMVWAKGNSLPNFVTVKDTGGINGWNVFTVGPPACPFGTTNGAQPGDDGGTLTNLQITEASVPFVQVTAQACCDTLVCPGETVPFAANGTATFPPPAYTWSNGNTNNNFSEAVYNTQTYTVTTTDHRNCTATAAVNVTVPAAGVSITATPDSAIVLGQSVQLTALSSTALTYQWSPTEGLSNTSIYNPVATPDVTTNYCVTVTNEYNCTGSTCKTIELLLPDIKVPDAFSPNADGVNDVFTIFEGNYADIQDIKIYNRWGEVVFTSPVNTAWDGTHKGRLQNAGSYVCRVVYSSPLNPGKTKEVVKDIVLIR